MYSKTLVIWPSHPIPSHPFPNPSFPSHPGHPVLSSHPSLIPNPLVPRGPLPPSHPYPIPGGLVQPDCDRADYSRIKKTPITLEINAGKLEVCNYSNEVVYLIWYGSRKKRADIDLLAVFDREVPFEYRAGETLDIYPITLEEFERLAHLFNPIVTEPILTGKSLLGDRRQFEKLRKKLSETSPAKEIVTHLQTESYRWYYEHMKFLATYEEMGPTRDKNFLLYALVDLSYAASYAFFARYYSKEQQKGPITLKELEERYSDSVLPSILNYLYKTKRDKNLLSLGKIQVLVKEWNGI